ncbi:hypothetical protein Mapa_000139 [Marchantia paleacea]|nr:hypothetical protein Mapa_000139 [Marchantia paleacea]
MVDMTETMGPSTLREERRKTQFDVEAMKLVWAGSAAHKKVADKIKSLVANDPVFEKANRPRLDRKALYKNSLRKAAHAWKLIQENHLTEEEASSLRHYIDEPTYNDLHWGMFIPAIKGQATEEQQKKWLPLAYKMSIIGCYAQTELGHGSNVQGLETQAVFDPSTDEFVLNSPTLTSTKWWPGGLGKASTHCVTYARLITDGKDYGIHAFIAPVRSLDDHRPLPGITVGDIGVKFGNGGYNTMDNGFLRFDHVRIPRDYMLMKLASVTREGKYVKSGQPKQIGYGAMVYVRTTIVVDASNMLSRAVTIATRYSAVRRQFGTQKGKPETQVIEYATQQSRLFPLIASAYAFRFVGEWMKSLYDDVLARLAANDFSTLPEVHACTSGLKSITTSITADGIEECRKLCGGHGYACNSGLPELYAAYVPSCTYEGDNTILLFQVARFLMKALSQVGSGKKPTGTAAYLGNIQRLATENCKITQGTQWLSYAAIVEAFQARAARLAGACALKLSKAPNAEAAFEEFATDLAEAARAHCQLIIVEKFVEKMRSQIPGGGVPEILEVLCYVYALDLVRIHAADFLSTGYLTSKQISLAKEQLRSCFKKIRPNAVALVDSFDHTDHYLSSILGRYDGDVYSNLYKDAQEEPLNDSVVTDGYAAYIRPVLKNQLRQSKL